MKLSQDQRPAFTPLPFLGPLFESGIEPQIEAGYLYSPEDTQSHGISLHRAIDFALPGGTAVLAPADGWAVCTFGEVQLTENDEPRLISLAEATKHTAKELLAIPDMPGEAWPAWYGSFVIHLWHGAGLATQYAHLDWVRPDIPYFEPLKNDKGDLLHNRVWRRPAMEFRSMARKVKKGEIIGHVGMTGCGWGKRTYETAKFGVDGRPDFTHSDYWHWDQPHLHFMALGTNRGPKNKVVFYWDPFGVYGDNHEKYPSKRSEWADLPNSLWL